ncbi:B12-binding domain-containing radical SAM protein [Actinacidiphila soli]|uniref:B12-binding domain-containing radical SAM protein n=1 Tax=Actinacidiphila soli TaxID=2487275 RepID=UPI0013E3A993|nr:cobalamin-dependent protein [Actinacidiphila soli]
MPSDPPEIGRAGADTSSAAEPGDAELSVVKSVVFVELPTYENMLPLASGYMQAYAQSDPRLRSSYSFDIVSAPVTVEREKIYEELAAKQADVYAFSCYIWNMKVVNWLLARLMDALPTAHFLLGGPQAMNYAERYIPEDAGNVYVCNGEGEKTFHEFLRQFSAVRPDMRQVPGLSFRSHGELVTTAVAPRVKNMMELPSPFLSGVFEGHDYSFAIMETNRGCPFSCSFCYWGAATNDKVHKFELDRIKDELTWISTHNFSGLFIADANWGLSPQDVELSEHIVQCSKETGYPLVVHMAAAKNKPERMAEITETFVRGGLMVTQPISLQSLNPLTLELVDRKNIREATYISLQRSLREKQISSYVELIWPLPGETYETFKDGLTKLCRSYADTVIVYPQLMLHNTPMYSQQEIFGVQTEAVPSDTAEADVVVATKWVSKEECRSGYWLNYALHTLYNMRALFLLSGYLDGAGIMSYGDLFSDVADYFRSRNDSDICRFFGESVQDLANYDLLNSGKTAHMTLSSHRQEFDHLLTDWARQQDWWTDLLAREAFELDLLARPYIYREPVRLPDHGFARTHVHSLDDEESFLVDVSAEMYRHLQAREIVEAQSRQDDFVTVRIDHRARQKMPYMAHRSLEHNANYCQGMVLRFREVLPNWQVVQQISRTIG